MEAASHGAKARARRAGSKESRDKNLNLVDVYDIAADIGKVGIIFYQI